MRKNGKKRNKVKKIAVIALIIVLLSAGAWFFVNKSQSSGVAIDKNAYQAVFLTNGQVYFGKLKSAKGDYIELTDIYYLQVQQTVQPTTAASTSTDSGQTQLVKLGNELHGPQDEMEISSKQILFWENLKTDGKVAQAISQYKP